MDKQQPVAWMLKTGHGTKILEKKPYCEVDYWKPLYTHPVKELHLSLQKSKQTGELLAVTYTDDEHRIVEVLWEKPPVKELTSKEIMDIGDKYLVSAFVPAEALEFANAILRKAQET